MGGQKKACFPCKFIIVGPDAWSAGNVAGIYAGQPLNAGCASCAEGLVPLLCALSPTSRVYLSQGLSIRVTLFEGRNIKLTVVSTQTAHFVDRCIRSLKLSTKTRLFVDRSLNSVLASTEIPVFMDKSTKPTVVSTKQPLFMDGDLNVAVMAILGPSHKRQSRHADPHARRKDRPQGSEALPES